MISYDVWISIYNSVTNCSKCCSRAAIWSTTTQTVELKNMYNATFFKCVFIEQIMVTKSCIVFFCDNVCLCKR